MPLVPSSFDDLLADEERKRLAEQWATKRGGMEGEVLDAMPYAQGRRQVVVDGEAFDAGAPITTADRFRSLGDAVGAIQQRLGPEGLNRYGRGMDAAARIIAGIQGEGVDTPPSARDIAASAKAGRSTDPASPASKAAQARVRAVLAGQLTDEEIGQVTEESEERVLKYGSLSRRDEITREGHVDANTRFHTENARLTYQFAQKYGLDLAKMSQEQQQFIETLALKEKELDAKRGDKVDAQAKDYGAAYAESGLPEFETYYGEAQALFKKYPKSLPGVGMVAGRAPRRFTSTDGKNLRSIFGQMLLAYKKSVTGLGSSAKEDDAIREATGLVDTGDDESMRLGVEMLKRVMDAKAGALKAGFKPEAVDAVTSRLRPKTTAAPAASVLPTDANGQSTLEEEIPWAPKVPPGKKLKDMLNDGDVRRVNMGNGKSRLVKKVGDKLVPVKEN